jgi:predicted NBD/HSP70 family sugar kinase
VSDKTAQRQWQILCWLALGKSIGQETYSMNVLSIDIGGTGLKAAVVDEAGNMLTQRVRVGTPHPSPPDVIVDALVHLVAPLSDYEAVSVGFPGVVRQEEF